MVAKPVLLGEPLAPEATLWRFMDFTKYVAMLHGQALYFSRADQLPDPFEGLSARHAGLRQYGEQLQPRQALRRQVLLSCWHQNEHESAAMWRIYLSGHEGVAIKSNANRLCRALSDVSETLYVGRVRYLDEWPNLPPGTTELDAFFCKRKSFDYEREARVLWCSANDEQPGRYLAADLEALIEEVVVSPAAEAWFSELVLSVSKKYGLDVPVCRSALLDVPGAPVSSQSGKPRLISTPTKPP